MTMFKSLKYSSAIAFPKLRDANDDLSMISRTLGSIRCYWFLISTPVGLVRNSTLDTVFGMIIVHPL